MKDLKENDENFQRHFTKLSVRRFQRHYRRHSRRQQSHSAFNKFFLAQLSPSCSHHLHAPRSTVKCVSLELHKERLLDAHQCTSAFHSIFHPEAERRKRRIIRKLSKASTAKQQFLISCGMPALLALLNRFHCCQCLLSGMQIIEIPIPADFPSIDSHHHHQPDRSLIPFPNCKLFNHPMPAFTNARSHLISIKIPNHLRSMMLNTFPPPERPRNNGAILGHCRHEARFVSPLAVWYHSLSTERSHEPRPIEHENSLKPARRAVLSVTRRAGEQNSVVDNQPTIKWPIIDNFPRS